MLGQEIFIKRPRLTTKINIIQGLIKPPVQYNVAELFILSLSSHAITR